MSKFSWINRLFSRCFLRKKQQNNKFKPVQKLEDRIVPALAVGDFNGDRILDFAISTPQSTVQLFSGSSGLAFAEFASFSDWQGAKVNLAAGDFNGDGADDLVIGAGNGGSPRVRILDGQSGHPLFDQILFEPTFRGGVYVASGDATGDGKAELFVGAGMGGGPRVQVRDIANHSVLQDFFAYESTFRGGVQIRAGDANGDGRSDAVTGAGDGGGPRVFAFDGTTGATIRNQFVGDPSLRNGIIIGAADIDGNERVNTVALAENQLRVFAGINPDPFVAFTQLGSVSIHSGDLNGDGFDELLLDDGQAIRGYDGTTLTSNGFVWTPTSTGAFAKPLPTPKTTVYQGEAIRIPGVTGEETTIQIERLRQYTRESNEIGLFLVDSTCPFSRIQVPMLR
ncbi:MAG: VCBS repeat-containing protein [Gemmataceae bacterium]